MVTRFIDIKVRTKSAEPKIDRLDKKMKGLGKTADVLSTQMTKVAKSVAAALTIGALGKVLLDAATAATKFNAAISNLSAITGAVGKDLEFLRQTALEFGATTTLSATQAAEALKLVASAKPDLLESGEALKEVTKQAILLAEASGTDLANAAKIVGSSLNQFSADAAEAARFVNVLAAGAKFGASEIEETAVALRSAGVAAADAGVSFEETNAAIQVLATVGLKAEKSGTALRNIFLKLDNDADKKLRPSLVGIEQALVNLNKKNLDGTQLLKRFGLENIVAAKTLLKNTDAIGKFTEKLTGTNTATEQARVNMDNLAGDVKALGSAFETLQINLGTLVDDEMRDFTKSLTLLLRAINDDEEALKEWGGIIDTTSTVLQSLAILLAAKFTVAIAASTIALVGYIRVQTAATITTNAFGTVLVRTTVATNAMAIAATGLSRAMAFLGGPVGIALIAAGALITFNDVAWETEESSNEAAKSVDTLKESFDKMSRGAQGASINAISVEIKKVSDRLILASEQLIGLEKLTSARGTNTLIINKKNEIEDLNDQLDILSEKQSALIGPLDESGFTLKTSKVEDSEEDKPKTSEVKTSKFANQLAAETEQLRLELEIRNAVRAGFLEEEVGQEVLTITAKLTRQQTVFDAELLKLGDDELAKEALRAQFREFQILTTQEFQQNLTDVEGKASQERIDQAKKESDEKKALNNQLLGTAVNLGTSLLKNSIANNAKSEKEKKRARKKGVIIDTAAGISLAFATSPYPVAIGISAAIAATGLANLATISSASGIPQPSGNSDPSAISNTATSPTQQVPFEPFSAIENTALTEILDELRNKDPDETFTVDFTRRMVAAITDAQSSGQI